MVVALGVVPGSDSLRTALVWRTTGNAMQEQGSVVNSAVLDDASGVMVLPGSTRSSEWAVETRGLAMRFGESAAVDNVELLEPRRCIFGYLGLNGVGRTTLIGTLLGPTHADGARCRSSGPWCRANEIGRCARRRHRRRAARSRPLVGRQNLEIVAAVRERAARSNPDVARTSRHR